MDLDEKAIIWLDSFEFASYTKKTKFFELFDSYKDIFDKKKFESHREEILKIFDDKEFSKLTKYLSLKTADKIIEFHKKLGIGMLTYISEGYPETLLNIDSAPFVLYYKGDINLLNSFCISIVGSRKTTNYGVMATEKFAKELVSYGVTIVSGLAYGIDSIAHNATLEAKGKTIAVLAGGLDNIYPTSNFNLAKQIIESGGLLISEHRAKIKAEAYMFPFRNRIMAGLSRGVLITEAHALSGTVHTKNFALDYGRDVFAVPGSIFSEASAGSNRMITNGHAKAVSKIEDIVEEYNLVPYIKTKEQRDFTDDEEQVIEFLQEGQKTFQEIVECLGFETSRLNTLLTKLAIRGIIKKLAGNVYFLV